MYGVDNTFLSRTLEADLFVPYESPLLEHVPEAFLAETEQMVTPIDYGDVCLNYDVAYFEDNDLALPESLADLTEPAYADLLVVENPASSSPGLAFLLATIDHFGTPDDEGNAYTYLDYWADLVANDVLVVDGWSEAYYDQFSGSAGSPGTRPLVVSYASSPPVEVIYAEEPVEKAPTGTITAPGMCFRQVEYAGILNGTEHVEAAQQFIDFMLSVEFQEDMPLQMFVFPVNEDAELPDVFTEHATVAEEPVQMNSVAIDENREAWIQAWVETVLR
jgi:thiamine transport system substrate-binding protein